MDKENAVSARSMFKHCIFVPYSTGEAWCKTNNNETV
jgi:hypothetical protein